ncbi:hypothetical protein Hanom_Chr01g00033711 [Helianthus anomalus]
MHFVLTTCASIRLFSCICPTGATTLWIFTISLFICHGYIKIKKSIDYLKTENI